MVIMSRKIHHKTKVNTMFNVDVILKIQNIETRACKIPAARCPGEHTSLMPI